MNGPPKTWLYTKIRAYIQNLLITTFGPYMHRYNNKQQLFNMATLFFGYSFQSIGGRSADFTNPILSCNFFLQASFFEFFPSFWGKIKTNKHLEPFLFPLEVVKVHNYKKTVKKLQFDFLPNCKANCQFLAISS